MFVYFCRNPVMLRIRQCLWNCFRILIEWVPCAVWRMATKYSENPFEFMQCFARETIIVGGLHLGRSNLRCPGLPYPLTVSFVDAACCDDAYWYPVVFYMSFGGGVCPPVNKKCTSYNLPGFNLGRQCRPEPGLHRCRGLRHRVESAALSAVVGSGRLGRTESADAETPAWKTCTTTEQRQSKSLLRHV